jgi:hypothetical protein
MAHPFAASALAFALLSGAVPAAQGPSTAARRTATLSPALALERLEAILVTLDADRDEHVPQVEALTAALGLIEARTPARPGLPTLADALVTALAPAFVDDELAERLGHDLYALLATDPNRRELGLLVDDVTILLRQAGVEPLAAQRVLRELRELTGLPAPDRESPESAARE